jgi:hypothetical protein
MGCESVPLLWRIAVCKASEDGCSNSPTWLLDWPCSRSRFGLPQRSTTDLPLAPEKNVPTRIKTVEVVYCAQ